MVLKYISNRGIEADLNCYPYRALPSDLLDYEWDVVSDNRRINSFVKTFVEKKINIDIFATTKSALENANILTDIFEADILDGKPGRLFVNEQYLQCYICGSVKKSNWKTIIQQCEYKLITDNPFWISESMYALEKSEIESKDNKKYKNKYKYRYASGQKERYIINDHFVECPFLLRFYGPCVNPSVTIDGVEHSVNAILSEGEYIEIDSRTETVVKVLSDGKKENLFHYRNNDIFKKIGTGKVSVVWNNQFNIDIVLYKERSEPRWI